MTMLPAPRFLRPSAAAAGALVLLGAAGAAHASTVTTTDYTHECTLHVEGQVTSARRPAAVRSRPSASSSPAAVRGA